MTDATHPVTQSTLETFARGYFNGLGASVQDNGDRWHVRLPSHVNVGFSDGQELEVVLGDRDTKKDGNAVVLSPESEFAQQLLDEAAGIATVGQLALTENLVDDDHRYPSSLSENDVSVVDSSFNPYYDRTAVCVFVKIALETVSEYQTQFLEAVTVDVESKQQLPGISEGLLNRFFGPEESLSSGTAEYDVEEGLEVPSGNLADAISVGQKTAVEAVEDAIKEVRESAYRSADSEFEEYRQLQEQRINEIREEINRLSDRLQDLTTEVDNAESQHNRVELLEKRRELKNEKEDLEVELEDLLQEKDSGFAQQREEIYGRHAIEVTTEPVASTLIAYERGEIEFTLSQGSHTGSFRAPYAIGAGVTDEVTCDSCQERLSEANPISVTRDGIGCRSCR